MTLNPQEHLNRAKELLAVADEFWNNPGGTSWSREDATFVTELAQAHVALAKAQRYLALSQ